MGQKVEKRISELVMSLTSSKRMTRTRVASFILTTWNSASLTPPQTLMHQSSWVEGVEMSAHRTVIRRRTKLMMVYECAACRSQFRQWQQLTLHWTTKHFERHVQYYCPVNKCLRRFVSKEAFWKHLRCNRHRTSWRDAEEREDALKTIEPFPQEMKSREYISPGIVPPPVRVVLPSKEKDAPKPHHRAFKSVNPYWRLKGYDFFRAHRTKGWCE